MQFVYTGEPDRYYPTLGLTPVPGETYEHEADPSDGRWSAPREVAPGVWAAADSDATHEEEK